jgi:hypothetical protein
VHGVRSFGFARTSNACYNGGYAKGQRKCSLSKERQCSGIAVSLTKFIRVHNAVLVLLCSSYFFNCPLTFFLNANSDD